MAVLPDSFLSIATRTSAYIHSVCQESIIACRKNHFSILFCHYGNQRKFHLPFKKTALEQPFSVISSLKYSCPSCHPQSFASSLAAFCIVIRSLLHRHLQSFASSLAVFCIVISCFSSSHSLLLALQEAGSENADCCNALFYKCLC